MLMWYGSWVAGLILIGLGLLIIYNPNIVAYVIATLLIMAGAGMLGSGWSMRNRVTYRRVDEGARSPFDSFRGL